MSSDPLRLTRRFALGLGGVVLANVAIEGTIAVVAGNPSAPPLSTPETRFLILSSGIQALPQIIGGLGLLAVGCWALAEVRTQKRIAWSFLGLAGAILAPFILVIADFARQSAAFPTGPRMRLQIQLVRLLVFYTTISYLAWSMGRLLLARSRRVSEPATLPP